MSKVGKWLTADAGVSNWHYWLVVLALWSFIGRSAYDWWTFDRIMDTCLEQKMPRCQIGETTLHIQYH